jgi:phosphatidyl-myo-inositol dimannoside synthase
MKRTLLVTIDFPPMVGGVATYWSNLCKYLPKDDFVVLAQDFTEALDFDIKQDYLIYRHNLISKSKWVWPKWFPLLSHTFKMIRREKIEKIIVAHVLPTGTVALLARWFLRVPYIVSVHGLDVNLTQISAWKKKLTMFIMKNAEKVIANSEYTKSLLVKYNYCSEAKVKIVYPCPNEAASHISERLKQKLIDEYDLADKKIMLTVGRLIKRKGQDKVLQALPQILQKEPHALYIMVGKGEQFEKLKQKAVDLGVRDKVLFFFDVTDEELPVFYDLAQVFIMPCREEDLGDVEGFGIVFLEANSYSRPVIAGRSGGAVEAVVDGKTGLLVTPENTEEIARAAVELLTDREKASQLGVQGKERVQERFTWEKQAEKLIQLLD